MKVVRNRAWQLGMVFVFVLALVGCSGGQQSTMSPNEIIANAVEKSKSYQTYYMKSEMKVYKNKKQTADAILEEWHDKKGHRTKSVSKTKNGDVTKVLNDGKQILIYTKTNGKETASKATSKGLEENKLIQDSQKEQMKNVLKRLKKDHQIMIVGEEKVVDRSTYHIEATPNDENTFTGKQEIWIDQDTWLPLKMISFSGDMKFVIITKHVEFDPNFKKGTFNLDIPNDVKVKDLEKMNPTKKVDEDEAEKALGQSFLKVKSEDYRLQKIEFLQLKSTKHVEITLYYQKGHVPQFRISVMPTPRNNKIDSSFFDKMETMTVRGDIKAKYMKEPVHYVFWDEGGLRYTMLISKPDLKQSEVKQIINGMVLQ